MKGSSLPKDVEHANAPVLNEIEPRAREGLAIDVPFHQISSVLGVSRLPCARLRPFVHTVWATDSGPIPPTTNEGWVFERVLPTGLMHVVFRWSELPLIVRYDEETPNPIRLSNHLIGGARARSYQRQLGIRSQSVGALLYPGTSRVLFDVPAGELAERHTALEDVWPETEVSALRDRLEAARSAEARIRILEEALSLRVPQVRGLHPAVAETLSRLARAEPLARIVEGTGYSHRRVISLFHDAVGLTPKVFVRISRLQRAIELLSGRPRPRLAEVALEAGYADQSHLTREFNRIAGVSPAYYRKVCPEGRNHVPVAAME